MGTEDEQHHCLERVLTEICLQDYALDVLTYGTQTLTIWATLHGSQQFSDVTLLVGKEQVRSGLLARDSWDLFGVYILLFMVRQQLLGSHLVKGLGWVLCFIWHMGC